MPRSPLPAFVHEWAGTENAVYLLADRPAEVSGILALLEAGERPLVDSLCADPPPLVHFPDNLTSDTFTPLFGPFMDGPYRRRLARLHAAGIAAAVHLDGRVRGLLPLLAATGIDAIEAVTPEPAGDASPADMRTLAANAHVILWGGVPGVMFAPPFTWRDMERHIGALLDAWQGSRFVVGVADQVPPDGDISLCSRISDMLSSVTPCWPEDPRR